MCPAQSGVDLYEVSLHLHVCRFCAGDEASQLASFCCASQQLPSQYGSWQLQLQRHQVGRRDLSGQGTRPARAKLLSLQEGAQMFWACHSQSIPFPFLHRWSDSVPVFHRCHGLGSSAREVGPLHPSVGCSGRPIMLRFGADTPGRSPGVFARYHGA